MTTKDYLKAAEIISKITDRQEAMKVCEYFCLFFRSDNIRFNKAIFLKACNLP